MLLVRFAVTIVLLLLSARPGFADGWPPTAADISVTLSRGHGGCIEGNDCRLVLQVENLGTASFKGRLSVVIETAAASVPGFAGSGPWRCDRLGYGRMACAAAAIELAPAQTSTGLISVRFLPTHMSEAEACASIAWRGTASTVARDALRSAAAALGGLNLTRTNSTAAVGCNAVVSRWTELGASTLSPASTCSPYAVSTVALRHWRSLWAACS